MKINRIFEFIFVKDFVEFVENKVSIIIE